ncbi:MAG: hypothetical protein ABIK31_04000 [candidate division WOR-3 bacterium]
MHKRVIELKNWTKKINKDDTLLAHFYIRSKESKVLDNPGFFYLNMLSSDRGWIVKGTTGHGIPYKDLSEVPCLNFFLVDDVFYKALNDYYTDQEQYKKFECAILVSQKELEKQVKEIIKVRTDGRPKNQKECHHFDSPKNKIILSPFNRCIVMRAEIPINKTLNQPICRLTPKTILGIMVQYGQVLKLRPLLQKKGLSHVKVFSL